MNNKEIVKELVKLQILTVRWVERHTNLVCKTMRDVDRILTGSKFTVTYAEGVKNLKGTILKHCDNTFFTEKVAELEEVISNSNIADMRFGLMENSKIYSDEEKDLAMEMMKRELFMQNSMVSIKVAAEELGVPETTIKQACQQERLLNTRKVGKTWEVHLPECRAYWGIKDTNQEHLYKDWVY